MSVSNAHEHTFVLAAGIEDTFELFSNPHRLNELTPSWFDLEPVAESPKNVEASTEIEYRLRWRGLPFRWISRIVEWDSPHLLTYEQVRGPYRYFRHEHLFREQPGGTMVVDRVRYRVLGGRLLDGLVVRRDLKSIFEYREQAARAVLSLDRLPSRP